MTVREDETVLSLTTGGGGYGSPLERAPARVQCDLDEGWISRRRAEQVYGVVVGRDKQIDLEATKRRRLAMTRKTLRSSRRGNKKDRASAP